MKSCEKVKFRSPKEQRSGSNQTFHNHWGIHYHKKYQITSTQADVSSPSRPPGMRRAPPPPKGRGGSWDERVFPDRQRKPIPKLSCTHPYRVHPLIKAARGMKSSQTVNLPDNCAGTSASLIFFQTTEVFIPETICFQNGGAGIRYSSLTKNQTEMDQFSRSTTNETLTTARYSIILSPSTLAVHSFR